MAQRTNLNITPYYDDFDDEKNFHKVLYKPGFPIQARELTTSQSILQNQIGKFGTNIFKEGSVVIPGGHGYVDKYQSVKLNTSTFGVDVSVYIKNFIGKTVVGEISGVRATVKNIALTSDSQEVTNPTLFVLYTSVGSVNNTEVSLFQDGEDLFCTEDVVYGNTTIFAGNTFASAIESNSVATGTAAYINKGTFFVREHFVNVSDQTLILDYYNTNSSYKVGLQIVESIVKSDTDESLFDNAKGFTNYSAPGADRFKIELVLTKRDLNDNNTVDFIELMRIKEGKKVSSVNTTEYNIIRDYMAQRTYDESGHYSVIPFIPSLHNSLNDKLGNAGLYFDDELTQQQNQPSDDVMCLKLQPGKAYVRGYDIIKEAGVIIDVDKPREVANIKTDKVDLEVGYNIVTNAARGTFSQNNVVKLYNEFHQEGPVPGDAIGEARLYSFNLRDAAYVDDTTEFDLKLYDIQTYTQLVLNTDGGVAVGNYIKGKSSGASGYIVDVNSATIKLSGVSGDFARGEQIQINGVDNSRTIKTITEYDSDSIISIAGSGVDLSSVSANDFRTNVLLGTRRISNIQGNNVTISSSGVISSSEKSITGLKVGMIVRYQIPGQSIVFNRVSIINADGTITVSAISSLNSSYSGALPSSNVSVNNIAIAGADIRGSGSLVIPTPHINLSSINLSSSNLRTTKKISKQASSGSITLPLSDIISADDTISSSSVFETFDQERYTLISDDGTIEPLSSEQVDTSVSGQITFNALEDTSSTYQIFATVLKEGIRSKTKTYTKSAQLTISKSRNSGSGSTNGTLNDGLTTNSYYGLRVQDEEISLNVPDVAHVIAVYESLDSADPTFDQLEFSSTSGVETNSIIGENIVGNEVSNKTVVARVVSKDGSKVNIVYLTSDKFIQGQNVKFEESNIQSSIQSISFGNYKDITRSYILDNGQRKEYCDYSRIVRKPQSSEPTKRLTIVFDHYVVPSNDKGDFFTVSSYDNERYNDDIPNVGNLNIRLSDTIDFRPRVATFTATNKSPFSFASRSDSFNTSSITHYLTPEESISFGYEYYLPRIDSVFLNRYGSFIYEKGISSDKPKAPIKGDDSLMEVCTIKLPPYLYNPSDASFILNENKRYTMKDIGSIDDRVSTLEEVTTLSLLESKVEALQIQDAEGFNRFKSGFFVDPFKNYDFINRKRSIFELNSSLNEIIPVRVRSSLKMLLVPKDATIDSNYDDQTNFELLDSNVQKTGQTLSLAYKEIESDIKQIFSTENKDGVKDTVNVNPFEVPIYQGSINLIPTSDNWSRTEVIEKQSTLDANSSDTQTLKLQDTFNKNINLDLSLKGKSNEIIELRQTPTNVQIGNALKGTDTFTGSGSDSNRTRFKFKAQSDTVTLSNTNKFSTLKLTANENDQFMRSRNVQFYAAGFKSFKRLYGFLDGQKIDIIPKLLKITPVSGAFEIGETVVINYNNKKIGAFRVCSPNHKKGLYNNPERTYNYDPHRYTVDGTPQSLIPLAYSNSSTLINVDTYAMSTEQLGEYYGYIVPGATLTGQTSKATATVPASIDLLADAYGQVTGSFFIRDPNEEPVPPIRIKTGIKTFKVSTSPTNEDILPGEDGEITFVETTYQSEGTYTEYENEIFTQENRSSFDIKAKFKGTLNTNINASYSHTHQVCVEYTDPVAQTFYVGQAGVDFPRAQDEFSGTNGMVLTAVDVFFETVDPDQPVICQIREVNENHAPSRTVIAWKQLEPPSEDDIDDGVKANYIRFSEDGTKATKFVFDDLVYLSAGKAYAIVLIAANSIKYKVWTAVHGNFITNETSQLLEDGTLQYNRQYLNGTFYKSQNGAEWTEDQSQDMTFKLYQAEFTSLNGTATFTNPTLVPGNTEQGSHKLRPNALKTLPQTGYLDTNSIDTSTSPGSLLVAGRKIEGNGFAGTSAVITGVGSSVGTSGVSVSAGGTNYPNLTAQTFTTTNITGNGEGLTLNVTSSGSKVTSVTVANQGKGYQIGDTVGITTTKGNGATFTVNTLESSQANRIFLTNIQGESSSFTGQLKYINDSNVVTNVTGISVSSVNFDTGINDGKHLKVAHDYHGMYQSTNKVLIDNVEPNTPGVKLATALTKSGASILLESGKGTLFTTFEGITVSGSQPGYLIINNEIIKYTTVSGDTISDITRGEIPEEHGIQDSVVKKYELNGVSLRRINKVKHDVSSTDIDTDHYYIEINRGDDSGAHVDRRNDLANKPRLSFNKVEQVGGSEITSSENIIFSAVKPDFEIVTPSGAENIGTKVSARIRTMSARSISGAENSFEDLGFEDVQIKGYNTLDSLRMVASKSNEDVYANNLLRGKSFSTILNLSSDNKFISPIIRLDTLGIVEFISSRLNNPITDYSSNSEIKDINGDDPHAAVYVSKDVRLSKEATGLRVYLSAYRHFSTDFRVLYRLIRPDSSEVEQSFKLFPGFDNLRSTNDDAFGDEVIDLTKNSGKPDAFVPSSDLNEFREYQYTSENNTPFIGFAIKIVMSGSNQAQFPRFSDIRAIALR
tara:strand:+ start:17172 stop:24692 length:7521 start_codon:yes stop_codon:yes gene_type:complete